MEIQKTVDQKRANVQCFLAEHAAALARQGSVVASWRRYQGRRLGPYYRLACRDSRGQRSLYLGVDTALVEDVRRALAELQRQSREQLQIRRVQRGLGLQLIAQQDELDRELQRAGLYRKGRQILGWRGFKKR